MLVTHSNRCVYVHCVTEWAVCLSTGPELGNGHMGGLLNNASLKGDALAQQSVTEGLLGVWTTGCTLYKCCS